MIRRLNRTGRRQVSRADVTLRLRMTEGTQPPIFDLDLHLDDYSFPPDARVRVEAWRSNAVQRWDFGTVGSLTPPPDEERRMRDVPGGRRSSGFSWLPAMVPGGYWGTFRASDRDSRRSRCFP